MSRTTLVAAGIAPVPERRFRVLPVPPAQPLRDDVVFPQSATDVLGRRRIVGQAHQEGGQPGIGEVELGRLDQALAQRAVVGLQEQDLVRGL